MSKMKFFVLCCLLVSVFFIGLNVFAQGGKPEACDCAKPAEPLLIDAYKSLESGEEGWGPTIEKINKARTKVEELEKGDCKCDYLLALKDVTTGYKLYAEAAKILDEVVDLDAKLCKEVISKYEESIKSLEKALPRFVNETIKKQADTIKTYAEEELGFVKEECQDKKT